MAQRLLDIHVFPGGHRVQRHAVMPVLRCRDQDRVYILVVQHSLEVAVGLGARAGRRETRLEVGLVHVADAMDGEIRIALELGHDSAAPARRRQSTLGGPTRWESGLWRHWL